LTRKESKAKCLETKILRLALGRLPTMYKQLSSSRGVSCCY